VGKAAGKKTRERNRAKPVPAGKSAKAGRGARLSRERIADAAMALVDRDGLAALSFRNLGAELG